MENIIEKLNQNRLFDLTEQDFENIANNIELKTLFLLKVKEGHQFDLENAYEIPELFSADYITIILDMFKEQQPEAYLEFFYTSESKIKEEFDEKTAEIVINYIKKNIDYVLNKISTIDIKNDKIENIDIIKNIIDNKIEKNYGLIYMEQPTEEFETLLLDALDRNKYNCIYTINHKILKKCLETNQLKAALYGIHPENKEEAEIIFQALENKIINYEDIHSNFERYYEQDLRIIKHKLRSSLKYLYLNDEIFQNNETRQLIIEEIARNHELADRWEISSRSSDYPDLAIAIIKYSSINNIKNIIKYKNETLINLINGYKDEVIDALIYNLDHNQSSIKEIIENYYLDSHYYPEIETEIMENPKFFNYFTSKISLDKIIHHLISHEYNGNREYYLKPTRYELLANAKITFTTKPKDINYKVNYPENVWLALIPLLDAKELTPSNIPLNNFEQQEKVFDCILQRLKELKSNAYNTTLEYYWHGPITQTLIDVVCDPSNPLNLNTTQKLNILPAAKMTNNKYLLEIIKQANTIAISDLPVLIPTLLKVENPEEVKKICYELFSKIEKSTNTLSYLSGITSDIYNTIKNNQENKPNISEQSLIFFNSLQEYLKTQKNIPLFLTQYFDQEVIEKATYTNLDALKSNPDFFLVSGNQPENFVEFIKKCQSQNLPIDLKIIDKVVNITKNNSSYNYQNITFSNDKETYDILYKLLNNTQENNIEKNIVDKWVNTNLTYEFFNCQNESEKSNLLNLLITKSEYTEKILEVINPNNIKEPIALSWILNRMLITKQKSQETSNKALDTIIQLINEQKMNIFKDSTNLMNYINLIDHPIFIDYVTKISLTNPNCIESLLTNTKYKEPTLKVLYKNTHLATNFNVTKLAKQIPEIKEYVKKYLEQDESQWTEFNINYLDIDLLNAYLKHHSIDKVITFIVHNQDLTLITPELYSIIKTNLLKQHPEYNQESYNILEKFYGLELLLLLETENFQKLLKANPNIAKKITEVFKERKLDEGIITSINDSFRQNYFSIENSHIINFYTNTLEKIQRGITEEEIVEVINVLINYIPSNLEQSLKETNNELLLNTYKVNKEDFLRMLIQELSNNQNIYAPVFNKITNNLIVQKRNEYRSTQDIYIDTNLKYELETKSLYNALFNYLSKKHPTELLRIIINTKNSTELDIKTIYFLCGNKDNYTEEELPQIKRNIPHLKSIILNHFDQLNENDKQTKKRSVWSWYDEEEPKKFPNLPRKYENLLNDPEFTKLVKKIPIYPVRKKTTEMFGNLNIDIFEMLANDEEKFNALIALLNKYRFLEWEDLFEPTIKKLSLGEDTINIFNFINAFSKIYDNEKKTLLRERKKLIDILVEEMKKEGKTQEEIENYIKIKESEPININITAYKILKYSTIYSSIANYYKIILGIEDFELVKRDDGPNASYSNAEERLQKASEMQIKMMELNEITIPSFIYDHETNQENKTKLRVTVGNRADSRNLTHGERTGACMRAYGHADTLFEFCNTDPRGFHIVFTDPETNEYVSRVSGFRNGNTVFLNQLRYSTNSNYSNEDVIEACKAVCEELIKRSKNSSMPIENVVASPSYALSLYDTQLLSESNIGKDVYTGYKDVSSNAVVLATTGENGLAIPLKLDGNNQPIYEPVRLQPKEYTTEQITDNIKISIQRINAIKECLQNKDNPQYYKTLDFEYELLEKTFIHIIIGQDWYAALDNNGNLTYEIAIQNEHSLKESNEAITKLNAIKEQKTKIGGFTNGI